jgi:hypothetical protein
MSVGLQKKIPSASESVTDRVDMPQIAHPPSGHTVLFLLLSFLSPLSLSLFEQAYSSSLTSSGMVFASKAEDLLVNHGEINRKYDYKMTFKKPFFFHDDKTIPYYDVSGRMFSPFSLSLLSLFPSLSLSTLISSLFSLSSLSSLSLLSLLSLFSTLTLIFCYILMT